MVITRTGVRHGSVPEQGITKTLDNYDTFRYEYQFLEEGRALVALVCR